MELPHQTTGNKALGSKYKLTDSRHHRPKSRTRRPCAARVGRLRFSLPKFRAEAERRWWWCIEESHKTGRDLKASTGRRLCFSSASFATDVFLGRREGHHGCGAPVWGLARFITSYVLWSLVVWVTATCYQWAAKVAIRPTALPFSVFLIFL